MHTKTMLASDLVVPTINDALDLFLDTHFVLGFQGQKHPGDVQLSFSLVEAMP